MIAEIVANTLGGILSQVFGAALGQPLKRLIDEREMRRALITAVARAEERFTQDYARIAPEITHSLVTQTRFVDLPSVSAALTDMFIHPFHDPSQAVATVQRSFREVLPSQVNRPQVDAAVSAFLHYLGEEVLYIPQLRDLYTLAFQKMTAESSQSVALHTAALVEGVRALHDDLRPSSATLPAPVQEANLPSLPRHNLPQRPYVQFIGREAELHLLKQLLLPYPRSRHFVVTLDGIGGVGKSALALELAYHYRDSFASLPPDERFEVLIWVSAKRTVLTASGIQHRQQPFSTLADLYREIATVFNLPLILQVDGDQRPGLVERALLGQRTLLILDNLETVDDEEILSFIRELPDPTKAIVTTRHRIDIAYAIRLTGMPQTDAERLITLESVHKQVDLPSDASADLYRRTGGIPLSIVWSIALMSLGYSVESVLRRLGSGHSDMARFCFEESMAHIRGRDAHRLLTALALFESSVKRTMLGEVAGLGNDEIGRDDALAELLQLSLINQERERFSLLPLTRSFVLDELERQPELEQALRERWVAYFTLLAHPYADLHLSWHDLPLIRQEGMHYVTLATWCQRSERLDTLLKIMPALAFYYDQTGQWTDLITIGQLALEYAQLMGDRESMIFIETQVMGYIFCDQGRYEEAERYIHDALNIPRIAQRGCNP